MDPEGSNPRDASVSRQFKIIISIRNRASFLELPIYAKAVPEPSLSRQPIAMLAMQTPAL